MWCPLASWLVGCSDPGYALYAVRGQVDLVARAQQIQKVLGRESLTDEQRERVRLILDIRDFAAKDLGLKVGANYTTYVDTGGKPVAYNLSASAKDSFTPVTWTFPLAGTTPCLGFFTLEEGKKYQSDLVKKGYDTVLYAVPSYSTAGLFSDPITSSMLNESDAELADLIVHESTHATIWKNNATEFDENLATFVARTGAIAYLTSRHGADSDIVRRARHRYEDAEQYNGFVAGLFAQMRGYYANDLTSAEKIAGRTALFEHALQRFRTEVQPRMHDPKVYERLDAGKLNNAWILLNARYNNDLSAFAAVYVCVDQDCRQALRIFADAARTADPIAYLRAAATPE